MQSYGGVLGLEDTCKNAVGTIESGPAAELGTFGGGVAMAFQPGGRGLAVGVTRAPQTGTFDELWLVERGTGQKALISRGPYVAYWWSPDSSRIAFLRFAGTDRDSQCNQQRAGFVTAHTKTIWTNHAA